MQISSFISDSYIINLCLGYQLCLICPLILLYFSTFLHRNPGIFSPYVWTLPSKSYLPFCLKQEYSYLCCQGGDVTITYTAHSFLEPSTAGLLCLSGPNATQRFGHWSKRCRGSRGKRQWGKPASVRSTATSCQLPTRLPPCGVF